MTVIIKPLITEKTLMLAARGWFTFAVAQNADKKSIGREISRLYKVQVQQVRTIKVPGKTRRTGKQRRPKAASDWKKSLVKLKAGQTIDAFEVTQETPSK